MSAIKDIDKCNEKAQANHQLNSPNIMQQHLLKYRLSKTLKMKYCLISLSAIFVETKRKEKAKIKPEDKNSRLQ